MARAPLNVESIDFEAITDGEIRDLISKARSIQKERFERRLDEIRIQAREAGYELHKIGEAPTRGRKKRTTDAGDEDRRREVLPKYRNPDNPDETWTGRGRKPKWVESKTNAGHKLEEFVIPTGAESGSGAVSGGADTEAQE